MRHFLHLVQLVFTSFPFLFFLQRKLKEFQSEKELLEKEARESERRKTQLKQAIRQEQHMQDSLEAEIDDATAMMEGLDDNVNLVLAKDYMAKVEELKKSNAAQELDLLEQVKAAEVAEALQWKVSMTLDEMKVLVRKLLKDRADELLSSESEESEPPVEKQISHLMGTINFSRQGSKVAAEDQDLERSGSNSTPRRASASATQPMLMRAGLAGRRTSAHCTDCTNATWTD